MDICFSGDQSDENVTFTIPGRDDTDTSCAEPNEGIESNTFAYSLQDSNPGEAYDLGNRLPLGTHCQTVTIPSLQPFRSLRRPRYDVSGLSQNLQAIQTNIVETI